MNTAQIVINALIDGEIVLTAEEQAGIIKAFSTRGAYAGYLKKNAPARSAGLARACWLAIQPNYYKISIPMVLMLSDVERATFNKLDAINFPAVLDKDMKNLQAMGVW